MRYDEFVKLIGASGAVRLKKLGIIEQFYDENPCFVSGGKHQRPQWLFVRPGKIQYEPPIQKLRRLHEKKISAKILHAIELLEAEGYKVMAPNVQIEGLADTRPDKGEKA